MSLKTAGTIAIPGAAGSEFDHAAFDAKSRRVFIAHTARDCIEVIDHDARRHIATLPGFPAAAGAVADDGQILVTNRSSASIALLDADTFETHAVFKTGPRPNGAVIWRDPASPSQLHRRRQGSTDAAAFRIERSQARVGEPAGTAALVRHRCRGRADLPLHPRALNGAGGTAARPWRGDALENPVSGRSWPRHRSFRGLLYVPPSFNLVKMNSNSGEPPTPSDRRPAQCHIQPGTGLVHVAIGEPGLVDCIDPRNGDLTRTVTGAGAHTTALVAPDQLYAISPAHDGILVLSDT